jgi:hypothetical protein
MKTELQIIKDLIKKYPNDMQLGSAVRRFITEEFWKLPKKKQKSKWQKELDRI